MNSSSSAQILLISVIASLVVQMCEGARNKTLMQANTFSLHRRNYPLRLGFRRINTTKNITYLLDSLLKGYDKKLRPTFGGEPTTVEIDIEVRSMGQISEMDMTYSMDCYFRQSWVDRRLAFSDTDEAFTLSVSFLERVWKPDTFIYNGKKSYVHLITTPNKFIRLYQNGKILYSSRVTIHANCPMDLADFPMDTQHCPLKVGSFGYTTEDVVYRWNENRQVAIAADMKLSQFDLIAAPSGFENITRRAGEFSLLLASLHLQRHMGNFLIQVYGPCMLLVVLSWVSFWLNREATSDRISLGVTTVLTMTFLGLEARKDLPKVSYSTALDLFVWLSFGFIFATIIEFAFVHYFTKVGYGEVYFPESSTEDDEDEDEEDKNEDESEKDAEEDEVDDEIPSIFPSNALRVHQQHRRQQQQQQQQPQPQQLQQQLHQPQQQRSGSSCISASQGGANGATHAFVTRPQAGEYLCRSCSKATRIGADQTVKVSLCIRLFGFCGKKSFPPVEETPRQRRRREAVQRSQKRKSTKEQQMNSVSDIDEISRVLFPLSFLLINLLYWCSYLSHSERISFPIATVY